MTAKLTDLESAVANGRDLEVNVVTLTAEDVLLSNKQRHLAMATPPQHTPRPHQHEDHKQRETGQNIQYLLNH